MNQFALIFGCLFLLCSCDSATTVLKSPAPAAVDMDSLAIRVTALEQDLAATKKENALLVDRIATLEFLPEVIAKYLPILQGWVIDSIDHQTGGNTVRVASLMPFKSFFISQVKKLAERGSK